MSHQALNGVMLSGVTVYSPSVAAGIAVLMTRQVLGRAQVVRQPSLLSGLPSSQVSAPFLTLSPQYGARALQSMAQPP
jgi:hypothetical protein